MRRSSFIRLCSLAFRCVRRRLGFGRFFFLSFFLIEFRFVLASRGRYSHDSRRNLYYVPFENPLRLTDCRIVNAMNAVLLYVCLALAATGDVLPLSVYTDDENGHRSPKTIETVFGQAYHHHPSSGSRAKRDTVVASPTSGGFDGNVTSKVSCITKYYIILRLR